MKGIRWLLLLLICGIIVAVGTTYHNKRARQAREAPPPPVELPPNTTATGEGWLHTVYDGNRPVVEIRARQMRQIQDPSVVELQQVELRIFQDHSYDRVRSALAVFQIDKGQLFSEGDVEITLGVPDDGSIPESKLVVIRTSGVHFDTKSGKAVTDKPTRFRFPRGEGQSLGASYEPEWQDLRMLKDVKLTWYGRNRAAEPMYVETGHLVYKEDLGKIDLSPWSRFRHGGLTLEGADSFVFLENDVMRRVDTREAHGAHIDGNRRTVYRADSLELRFGEDATLEKINGRGNAKITSKTPGAETSVTSDRLYLEFKPGASGSVLDHALAMGNGKLRTHTLPAAGEVASPERVLSSNVIKLLMRPGGEQLQAIEAHAPGSVEFLPAVPGQLYRRLDGDRIRLAYGPGQQPESFRASKVSTRTEGKKTAGGGPAPPALTWSDEFAANFDPKTGELARIQQWGHFRYEEGTRKARAEHATFEQGRQLIRLQTGARVWDDRGATAADEILMDQSNHQVTARKKVVSTRIPDATRSPGGLLRAGETLHARADTMVSADSGRFIVYQGHAVMWQGTDRLRADRIEINREKGVLRAMGHVVSQFEDAAQPGKARAANPTEVSAGELTYLDEHRFAHYRKNVHLTQTGLDIHSHELRAYFCQDNDANPAASGAGSLHHALADGDVRIVQTTTDRILTGTSEHAEYHVAEQKVVLSGGRPKMVDSVRGTTQGTRLTYFAADDRLLVDGGNIRPAVSRLRRKP